MALPPVSAGSGSSLIFPFFFVPQFNTTGSGSSLLGGLFFSLNTAVPNHLNAFNLYVCPPFCITDICNTLLQYLMLCSMLLLAGCISYNTDYYTCLHDIIRSTSMQITCHRNKISNQLRQIFYLQHTYTHQ